MTLKMQSKYDKYWGDLEKVNGFLFIAALIDPRYKLGALEYWFKNQLGEAKGMEMTKKVEGVFERMFSEYCSGTSATDPPSAVVDSTVSTVDVDDDDDYFAEWRISQRALESKSEIERYLSERVIERTPDFDILNWWKVNSTKFPVISLIAHDVLAIPITIVPSKSVFSTGGRILDPFRSSLAPKTAEGLICAQNWLRGDPIVGVVEAELYGSHNITEDEETYRLDSGKIILWLHFEIQYSI
jgi:hypothetical protein